MDSDKRWYDVEFTINGTMRTEGYSKDDAAQRVADNLDTVEFNPVRYDNREVHNVEVELRSCSFVPQGYRLTDAVVCEGSGAKKLVPQVLCCCGEHITVVDNEIPVHYRTGPIVNGESSGS